MTNLADKGWFNIACCRVVQTSPQTRDVAGGHFSRYLVILHSSEANALNKYPSSVLGKKGNHWEVPCLDEDRLRFNGRDYPRQGISQTEKTCLKIPFTS
jgi:hypothetical protein